MCVSAKYLDLYSKACELVENLLHKIYSEYRTYCKGNVPYDLTVKKIESFVGSSSTVVSSSKQEPERDREPPGLKTKPEAVRASHNGRVEKKER